VIPNTASLRFTEEESGGFEGNNIANVQHQTPRVQRLIELDVQTKEEPGGTAADRSFIER